MSVRSFAHAAIAFLRARSFRGAVAITFAPFGLRPGMDGGEDNDPK
jgi:hypothetical protein